MVKHLVDLFLFNAAMLGAGILLRQVVEHSRYRRFRKDLMQALRKEKR